jgi:hypothetical protein
MASVVIILTGAGIYQLHKRHQEKKALRLEAEYDAEYERNRQLAVADDAGSTYSGNTLTNDRKALKRTESAESVSKTEKLRSKVRGLAAKARARDAGEGHGRVEQVAY